MHVTQRDSCRTTEGGGLLLDPLSLGAVLLLKKEEKQVKGQAGRHKDLYQ